MVYEHKILEGTFARIQLRDRSFLWSQQQSVNNKKKLNFITNQDDVQELRQLQRLLDAQEAESVRQEQLHKPPNLPSWMRFIHL